MRLSFNAEGRDARGRWTSVGGVESESTVHVHAGDELPAGLNEIERGVEFESAKGHTGTYDVGRDPDGNIHAANVRIHDEEGQDAGAAHETLGRIDLHHVRRAIAAQEHASFDERSAQDAEAERFASLSPDEQQTERQAAERQRQADVDAGKAPIHEAVDRLVSEGWKPELNQSGGLHSGKLPKELAGFASPSSREILKDRLRHHGFAVKCAEMPLLLSIQRAHKKLISQSEAMDIMFDTVTIVPAEFKFLAADVDYPAGEFRGYGAVFGNEDSHGDVIAPGAFAESLAERKAQGRSTPMHVMHAFYGGDGLPIGVWKSIDEDEKGLRVHGKISGMNTDAGKLNYERLRDGAFGGLSIGYSINPGGAVEGKGKGEPKRTLKSLALHEISLVDQPSNALARVDEIKARLNAMGLAKSVTSTPQADKAAQSIAKALALHKECMGGGDAPTAAERDQFLAHMQDAHEALTGQRMPEGMKCAPQTLRGLEKALREIGFSNSQAERIADLSMKLRPRDEAASDKADTSEAKAKAAAEKARRGLDFL